MSRICQGSCSECMRRLRVYCCDAVDCDASNVCIIIVIGIINYFIEQDHQKQ